MKNYNEILIGLHSLIGTIYSEEVIKKLFEGEGIIIVGEAVNKRKYIPNFSICDCIMIYFEYQYIVELYIDRYSVMRKVN